MIPSMNIVFATLRIYCVRKYNVMHYSGGTILKLEIEPHCRKIAKDLHIYVSNYLITSLVYWFENIKK